MRPAYSWLLAAAALLCGCGGAAKREATELSRILAHDQPGFAALNSQEKDLVTASQAWTEAVATGGAGQGEQLERNAAAADDLAKSADSISRELGKMRQEIYEQTLREEFPQGVRANLITQITKRQRLLQEIRSDLTEAATQFRALGQMRGYKGNSYPGSIDKLAQLLQVYKPPANVIGEALGALKDKYGLKGVDVST